MGEGADLAETVASRRDALRESVRRTPEFLAELRPSLVRLGELAGESEPLLADLQGAAPDLENVLDRLGPFAETARPAAARAGQGRGAGHPGAARGPRRAGRAEGRWPPTLPATAKPLRQLLQSLDDRRRAIDSDPRAKVNGPPPTDPSYAGGRGGFTGFESVANYFFWQVMSTNVFDEIGHLLRVGATTNKCSPFTNSVTDKQLLADCNSWLGPRQPGINAPDPGQPSPAATSVARRSERPASRRGERRGPGEPDAGPVPGQRDISKPQVGTPPAVEDLLKRLPELSPPKVPNAPQTPDQLLDFLLGAMRPRGSASLTASPLLVGAVTLLVAFVAVFLAYNANSGLPFVPTYDVKAELPTGAKLVKGNDVRVGGFRVGFVERAAAGRERLRQGRGDRGHEARQEGRAAGARTPPRGCARARRWGSSSWS